MTKSLLSFVLLIQAILSDAKQTGVFNGLENTEPNQKTSVKHGSKGNEINKIDETESLRKILAVRYVQDQRKTIVDPFITNFNFLIKILGIIPPTISFPLTDPIISPTTEPTTIPSSEPTTIPSNDPTPSPSSNPSSDPTASPSTFTSECDENDARIVGGVDAPVERYPYQVFLNGCGGSLIAPDYVLTAAHCSGVTRVVQIGRHDLANNEEEYETIAVELEIIHPDYCCETLDNDFMLLKLANSSSFDPVTLDNGTAILNDESDVTAIGWGVRCEGGPFLPDIMQEVTLDVVNNTACQIAYDTEEFFDAVTENMVCASRSQKDTCQGDSGGPILIKGKNAEEDIQVGVTSWGIGCAREGLPGVYARVSTAYDWIFETMGSDNLALKVLKNRAKRAFTKMGHDLKHLV